MWYWPMIPVMATTITLPKNRQKSPRKVIVAALAEKERVYISILIKAMKYYASMKLEFT